MAIKGKGRTRSRRVIAAPPRPQLVIRKKPIWKRRWVWAAVGLAAAAGITTAVLLHIRSTNERELKAATQKADTVISQAKATVAKIQAIDVTKVIPEDSEVTFPGTARGKGATRDFFINVQFLMTQAFGLYQDAAELMKQAATLTG